MKISYANVALAVSALVAGTAFAQGVAKSPAPALPAARAPGQSAATATIDLALLQEHCSTCHALDTVTAQSKTADAWAETMDRMVDHGMQISPEDSKKVSEFLIAHYGVK